MESAAASTPSIDDLRIVGSVACDVPGCNRVLPNPSCLRMHLVRHHRVVDGAPAATFNPRGALNKTGSRERAHWAGETEAVHQGIVLPPAASTHGKRAFFCPVPSCERAEGGGAPFNRLGHVKQHYWSVHGEKRFHCTRCGASFGIASVHARHVAQCGIALVCSCGESFPSKDRLRTHTRRTKCAGYTPLRAHTSVTAATADKAMDLLCLASAAQSGRGKSTAPGVGAAPVHQSRETQTTVDAMYEMYIAAPQRNVRVGEGGVLLSDSYSQTALQLLRAEAGIGSHSRDAQQQTHDDARLVDGRTVDFACGGDSPLGSDVLDASAPADDGDEGLEGQRAVYADDGTQTGAAGGPFGAGVKVLYLHPTYATMETQTSNGAFDDAMSVAVQTAPYLSQVRGDDAFDDAMSVGVQTAPYHPLYATMETQTVFTGILPLDKTALTPQSLGHLYSDDFTQT